MDKQDIITLEEVLHRYKSLVAEDQDIETQELLMFAEQAIDNLKNYYNDSFRKIFKHKHYSIEV